MLRVVNETRGTVLAERAAEADTFTERALGLIGRRGWGATDGLWIEPCAGVHALGMRFPVDVVLVDGAMTVVAVQTLHPWRIGRPRLDAAAALEVPVGTVAASGTRCGDSLAVERGPGRGEAGPALAR